jgi:hypothetical protein
LLTDEERARLDPRVQVEALEQFLHRLPAEQRTFVLNSFYADPAEGEMTIVGVVDPELERLWHRAWGIEEERGP